MKVAPFLLVCSLALLMADGHLPSRRAGRMARATQAAGHGRPCAIESARDAGLPRTPCGRRYGLYLDDEEDPGEDGGCADGFVPSPSWRDTGWGDPLSLAQVRHDLLRNPSHPRPLRC